VVKLATERKHLTDTLGKVLNWDPVHPCLQTARALGLDPRTVAAWAARSRFGTPLQDDIVRTTDRLLRLGQDILATWAVRAVAPVPDGGAGRDRLRDVLQDPRLP
jgi:hypothetical protein